MHRSLAAEDRIEMLYRQRRQHLQIASITDLFPGTQTWGWRLVYRSFFQECSWDLHRWKGERKQDSAEGEDEL